MPGKTTMTDWYLWMYEDPGWAGLVTTTTATPTRRQGPLCDLGSVCSLFPEELRPGGVPSSLGGVLGAESCTSGARLAADMSEGPAGVGSLRHDAPVDGPVYDGLAGGHADHSTPSSWRTLPHSLRNFDAGTG